MARLALVVALVGTLGLTGCDSSVIGKFSGSSKDAMGLFMRVAGQDLSAMNELIDKADKGDPWAALQTGYIFHTGTGGLKVNHEQAAYFYQKAERLPVANYNLALLYANGSIKPQEGGNPGSAEAIKRLQEAAEKADRHFVLPFVALAQIYEKGVGVPVNKELAASWYEKGASLEDPLSQFKLGMAYLKGDGRPLNPFLADKWLNNAADRWSTDAQLQMGLLLSNEQYQGYKPVIAAKWFLVAAHTRPEFTESALNYLGRLNEREQVAARRLAESWMKGHQRMPETPRYNKPINVVK